MNIDEGERLLAAMTPGDWIFDDGAIHSEDASDGAWIPSYTDDFGEVSDQALADGIAIEWLIINRKAMLAELRELREFKTTNAGYAQLGKGFFEMIDMADAVRNAEQIHNIDRTDAMIQVWTEQRWRIRDLENQVSQLTQTRDAGEGGEHG